ncbi:MAG: type II secretion system F family protein [Planctomycetota bacterium]|nr:type II secretion system F family protein [Planctomycetota bacterium]
MQFIRNQISFGSAIRAIVIGAAAAVSTILIITATQQGSSDDAITVLVLDAIFTLLWMGLFIRPSIVGNRRFGNTMMLIMTFGFAVLIAAFVENAVNLHGFNSDAPALLAWTIPFALLVVVARARNVRLSRTEDAKRLLSYVNEAVQLSLPLPQSLEAAMGSESLALSARLRVMREALEQGQPIEEALSAASPEMPARTVSAMRLARESGRLPQILRQLVINASRSRPVTATDPIALYEVYPFAVLTMMLLVMSALYLFVFPKFMSLFHDFHIDLPPVTKFVLISVLAPPFMCVVAALLIVVFVWSYSTIFYARMPGLLGAGELVERILWWIPIAGGYVRNRGLADLCRSMATSVQSGIPMDQALRDAAQTQASPVVRRRAEICAQKIQAGQPLGPAARHAGLPPLLSGMLATARDDQSLLAVTSFLANFYEYRFARAQAILRAAYVPAVVFILGTVVAVIALSVFQPMVALTRATARYAGGF